MSHRQLSPSRWVCSGVLLLLAATATATATAAPAARALTHGRLARPQVSAAQPLGSALRTDGSIRNVSGSFDARGYRMVLGRGGAPRFVRAGVSGSAPLTDAMWSENFGDVGLGATGQVGVRAVAVSGSKVYVGGAFHVFGWHSTVNYNNIAMWDGHAWHPLGSGTGPSNSSQVNAIALLGSDVYVGGAFATAGGITVNDIAKWNPTTGWHGLNSGVGGGCCSVNTIAVTGTRSTPTVYAGGNFTTIGGTSAADVARWNGTAWSPMGSGLTGSSNQVNALLLAGTTLYAAGSFAKSGATAFNSLAAWNGSAWTGVGGAGISNSFGTPATVNALAFNSATGTLYVGGNFAEVGGTISFGAASGATPASNVAAYDGSWDTLGGGISTTVGGVAFWHGKLFASYIASSVPTLSQWNGTAWSALAAPLGGVGSPGPTLIATTPGVIAVGEYTTGGGALLREVGLWNGTQWTGYGQGIAAQVNTVAALNHDVYAAGEFTSAGSAVAANIAHFNGKTWASMGNAGVSGGSASCGASGVSGGICTIAIDPATRHVFIGGSFNSVDGVPASNVAMWDGTAWHALGQGVDGAVEALLVYRGALYAGGAFVNAGGQSADLVAQWNLSGGGWRPLGDNASYLTGGGSTGFVNTLAGLSYAPYTHDVLIGGGFVALTDGTTSAQANGLVMFNTAVSSYPMPLSGYLDFPGNNGGPAGVGGTVLTLATAGSDVYVGGQISSAGGVPADGFGVLDLSNTTGTAWSVPGSVSGGGHAVYAITHAGTSVYLAGNFTSAGGVSANNVVEYTPGAATPWTALGAGIGSASALNVFAATPSANGVYVGGNFGMAGATTPSADIALWTATALPTLTISASPSPSTVGTDTTVTATVTNTDPTNVTGLTLTDTVPANATFVSATPSQGSCSLSGGTIKCALGALGAQGSGAETATVAIVLSPTAAGTLRDTAKLIESGTTFNNLATATVTIN